MAVTIILAVFAIVIITALLDIHFIKHGSKYPAPAFLQLVFYFLKQPLSITSMAPSQWREITAPSITLPIGGESINM